MSENSLEYRILLEGGVGEIEEKKSRFIATLKPVSSEEEANAFIDEMKKKYWDARHNVSAFVIGKKAELTRCTDDGEPSGTAGRPILEVLLNEGVRNVCVVVTRYFGGVLLGTGGLVRAYQGALKEGLKASKTGIMRRGVKLSVTTDYNGIGKLQFILAAHSVSELKTDYAEKVVSTFIIPIGEYEGLVKEITNASNGKAKIDKKLELDFIDKE